MVGGVWKHIVIHEVMKFEFPKGLDKLRWVFELGKCLNVGSKRAGIIGTGKKMVKEHPPSTVPYPIPKVIIIGSILWVRWPSKLYCGWFRSETPCQRTRMRRGERTNEYNSFLRTKILRLLQNAKVTLPQVRYHLLRIDPKLPRIFTVSEVVSERVVKESEW